MSLAPFVASFARFVSGATSRWVGCEPDGRQRIYFANHTSNLDFAVLWAVLPPEIRALTRPVAAADYWEGGKVRLYLATNIFNAVLIERKHVTKSNYPVTRMLDALGDRSSLVLFPEGSRSVNPEPRRFKGGLYHLAQARPDVELVPVYIENLNRVLPLGEFLPVPLLTYVLFGEPIRIEPEEKKSVFLDRARTAVCTLRDSWSTR